MRPTSKPSHIAVVLLALGLLLGPLACAEPPLPRDAVSATAAISGVTVVPMTQPDLAVPDQTVFIDGDRIAAIVPSDSVTVPEHVTQIDGTGRYLIPGLADMHVHLEYFDEPDVLDLFLANGITTVRNMDGSTDYFRF